MATQGAGVPRAEDNDRQVPQRGQAVRGCDPDAREHGQQPAGTHLTLIPYRTTFHLDLDRTVPESGPWIIRVGPKTFYGPGPWTFRVGPWTFRVGPGV